MFIRKPLKGQFAERICIVAKTPEEVLKDLPPLFLDLGLDGIILFDKNNKFYARDKVNIWQGKNYATCEEAEYDINDEHLILSNGSPCLYWQEEGRKGEYKAKKIVFNLHKKRIFLEDNVNGVVTYKE